MIQRGKLGLLRSKTIQKVIQKTMNAFILTVIKIRKCEILVLQGFIIFGIHLMKRE